eukprot:scpid22279/ scgid31323/ Centrosome-associated protein 350; Centrosome-associated protein of 350 kDa
MATLSIAHRSDQSRPPLGPQAAAGVAGGDSGADAFPAVNPSAVFGDAVRFSSTTSSSRTSETTDIVREQRAPLHGGVPTVTVRAVSADVPLRHFPLPPMAALSRSPPNADDSLAKLQQRVEAQRQLSHQQVRLRRHLPDHPVIVAAARVTAAVQDRPIVHAAATAAAPSSSDRMVRRVVGSVAPPPAALPLVVHTSPVVSSALSSLGPAHAHAAATTIQGGSRKHRSTPAAVPPPSKRVSTSRTTTAVSSSKPTTSLAARETTTLVPSGAVQTTRKVCKVSGPTRTIAASSWRSGQAVVNRVLGPSRLPAASTVTGSAGMEQKKKAPGRVTKSIGVVPAPHRAAAVAAAAAGTTPPVPASARLLPTAGKVARSTASAAAAAASSKDTAQAAADHLSSSSSSSVADSMGGFTAPNAAAQSILDDLQLDKKDGAKDSEDDVSDDDDTKPSHDGLPLVPVTTVAMPTPALQATAVQRRHVNHQRATPAHKYDYTPKYPEKKERHYDVDEVRAYINRQAQLRKQQAQQEEEARRTVKRQKEERLQLLSAQRRQQLQANAVARQARRRQEQNVQQDSYRAQINRQVEALLQAELAESSSEKENIAEQGDGNASTPAGFGITQTIASCDGGVQPMDGGGDGDIGRATLFLRSVGTPEKPSVPLSPRSLSSNTLSSIQPASPHSAAGMGWQPMAVHAVSPSHTPEHHVPVDSSTPSASPPAVTLPNLPLLSSSSGYDASHARHGSNRAPPVTTGRFEDSVATEQRRRLLETVEKLSADLEAEMARIQQARDQHSLGFVPTTVDAAASAPQQRTENDRSEPVTDVGASALHNSTSQQQQQHDGVRLSSVSAADPGTVRAAERAAGGNDGNDDHDDTLTLTDASADLSTDVSLTPPVRVHSSGDGAVSMSALQDTVPQHSVSDRDAVSRLTVTSQQLLLHLTTGTVASPGPDVAVITSAAAIAPMPVSVTSAPTAVLPPHGMPESSTAFYPDMPVASYQQTLSALSAAGAGGVPEYQAAVTDSALPFAPSARMPWQEHGGGSHDSIINTHLRRQRQQHQRQQSRHKRKAGSEKHRARPVTQELVQTTTQGELPQHDAPLSDRPSYQSVPAAMAKEDVDAAAVAEVMMSTPVLSDSTMTSDLGGDSLTGSGTLPSGVQRTGDDTGVRHRGIPTAAAAAAEIGDKNLPPPGPDATELHDGRLSPASLQQRFQAEMLMLNDVEEGMRQLSEAERNQAVALAQHETVSLAQIIKARQLENQQQLDSLSANAQREKAEAEEQLRKVQLESQAAASRATHQQAQQQDAAAVAAGMTALESVAAHVEKAAEVQQHTMEQVIQAHQDSTATILRNHQQDLERFQAESATSVAAAAAAAALSALMSQHPMPRTEAADIASIGIQTSVMAGSASTSSLSSPSTSHDRLSPSSLTEDISDRSLSESQPLRSSRSSSRRSERLSSSAVSSRLAGSSSVATGDSHDDTITSIAAGLSASASSALQASTPIQQKTSDYTAEFDSLSPPRSSVVAGSQVGSGVSSQLTVTESTPLSDDVSGSFSSGEVSVASSMASIDLMAASEGPASPGDSFTEFTLDMVRQLMLEEETRSRHQAALLGLREKAIREKARAEMSLLKQRIRYYQKKGDDDKMPQLCKRQEGLKRRVQAETAELKRLQSANEAARQDRQRLLQQQQDIARLREETKAFKQRLNKYRSRPRAQSSRNKSPVRSPLRARSPRTTEHSQSLSSTRTSVVNELSSVIIPESLAASSTGASKLEDQQSRVSSRHDTSISSAESTPTSSVSERLMAGDESSTGTVTPLPLRSRSVTGSSRVSSALSPSSRSALSSSASVLDELGRTGSSSTGSATPLAEDLQSSMVTHDSISRVSGDSVTDSVADMHAASETLHRSDLEHTGMYESSQTYSSTSNVQSGSSTSNVQSGSSKPSPADGHDESKVSILDSTADDSLVKKLATLKERSDERALKRREQRLAAQQAEVAKLLSQQERILARSHHLDEERAKLHTAMDQTLRRQTAAPASGPPPSSKAKKGSPRVARSGIAAPAAEHHHQTSSTLTESTTSTTTPSSHHVTASSRESTAADESFLDELRSASASVADLAASSPSPSSSAFGALTVDSVSTAAAEDSVSLQCSSATASMGTESQISGSMSASADLPSSHRVASSDIHPPPFHSTLSDISEQASKQSESSAVDISSSDSFYESEQSDVEARITALRKQLHMRRQEARNLERQRREQRRQQLRQKELQLKTKLEDLEATIESRRAELARPVSLSSYPSSSSLSIDESPVQAKPDSAPSNVHQQQQQQQQSRDAIRSQLDTVVVSASAKKSPLSSVSSPLDAPPVRPSSSVSSAMSETISLQDKLVSAGDLTSEHSLSSLKTASATESSGSTLTSVASERQGVATSTYDNTFVDDYTPISSAIAGASATAVDDEQFDHQAGGSVTASDAEVCSSGSEEASAHSFASTGSASRLAAAIGRPKSSSTLIGDEDVHTACSSSSSSASLKHHASRSEQAFTSSTASDKSRTATRHDSSSSRSISESLPSQQSTHDRSIGSISSTSHSSHSSRSGSLSDDAGLHSHHSSQMQRSDQSSRHSFSSTTRQDSSASINTAASEVTSPSESLVSSRPPSASSAAHSSRGDIQDDHTAHSSSSRTDGDVSPGQSQLVADAQLASAFDELRYPRDVLGTHDNLRQEQEEHIEYDIDSVRSQLSEHGTVEATQSAISVSNEQLSREEVAGQFPESIPDAVIPRDDLSVSSHDIVSASSSEDTAPKSSHRVASPTVLDVPSQQVHHNELANTADGSSELALPHQAGTVELKTQTGSLAASPLASPNEYRALSPPPQRPQAPVSGFLQSQEPADDLLPSPTVPTAVTSVQQALASPSAAQVDSLIAELSDLLLADAVASVGVIASQHGTPLSPLSPHVTPTHAAMFDELLSSRLEPLGSAAASSRSVVDGHGQEQQQRSQQQQSVNMAVNVAELRRQQQVNAIAESLLADLMGTAMSDAQVVRSGGVHVVDVRDSIQPAHASLSTAGNSAGPHTATTSASPTANDDRPTTVASAASTVVIKSPAQHQHKQQAAPTSPVSPQSPPSPSNTGHEKCLSPLPLTSPCVSPTLSLRSPSPSPPRESLVWDAFPTAAAAASSKKSPAAGTGEPAVVHHLNFANDAGLEAGQEELAVFSAGVCANSKPLCQSAAQFIVARDRAEFEDWIVSGAASFSGSSSGNGGAATPESRYFQELVFSMVQSTWNEVKQRPHTLHTGRSSGHEPWNRPCQFVSRRLGSYRLPPRPGNSPSQCCDIIARHCNDVLMSKVKQVQGSGGRRRVSLWRQSPMVYHAASSVEALAAAEMMEEEHQWTDYSCDEAAVKCSLADGVLDSLCQETASLLQQLSSTRVR